MAQITIDASGRELAARVTRNAAGEVVLVISAGEDGITINAGRTEDDADGVAGVGEAITIQAADLLNDWHDLPDENDGWVILGRDGYYVKLGSFEPVHQPQAGYPARQIAVRELAALMAIHDSTDTPAWITGEHGPATAELGEEVQAHLAGGQLVPLRGVRFDPGAAVLDNAGGYWLVRRDYGDLGVMLYADGDESVTRYTVHPDQLTEITEDSRG